MVNMTHAIIITTYNRPAELAKCFASLKRAKYLENTTFIIVDDASTDPATRKLIQEFEIPGCEVVRIFKPVNSRVCDSLLQGYDLAFTFADIAMSIDGDALVNNMFQYELVKFKSVHQTRIVTGFNCKTRNRNGSERHKIISEGTGYNLKESVGGINMVVHKEQYEKYMRPALVDCLVSGNWDHKTCINSVKDKKHIACLVPSVIQHQATQSSMGHTEPPDVADDFKPLTLNDVTMVCVDDNMERGRKAMIECTKNIRFGKAVMLTSGICLEWIYWPGLAKPEWQWQEEKINPLNSKEAYSAFIINDLHKYITTKHALIVQHDGFVVNAEAWDNEWLQYDYIGALWGEEYSPYRNGNGGFSLRSKKLLELTSRMQLTKTHPEDAVICRELRPSIEREHGIKFAPDDVADKFSYEGYNQRENYNGQFGVHGQKAIQQASSWDYKKAVIKECWDHWIDALHSRPAPKPEGLIFNQFLGLGDILFLVPMARHYMGLGHDVVWPVADEYQADLKRHFPDIQFVKKSTFPMAYDRRDIHLHRWQYGVYKVLPLRWNMCKEPGCSDAMTGKYTMMGLDWRMWRQLKWEGERNFEGTVRPLLMREKNYTDINEPYELRMPFYGCAVTGGLKCKSEVFSAQIEFPYMYITPGEKRTTGSDYQKNLPVLSLLDYTPIIENATIIHAVSSSSLYMLETLDLKAKEIHLYGRDKGLKDIDYVRPLLTKNYIFHP